MKIFGVLAVALCCSTTSLAETPADTTLVVDAFKGSKVVSVPADTGFKKGMSFKIGDGATSEVREITSAYADTQGTALDFDDALEHDHVVGVTVAYYEVQKPTDAPEPKPTATPTATLTAFDSSASSGSQASSGSLRSIGSGAAAGDSSSGDSSSGSFNQGSWQSDSSGSDSSGSTASGSWGSQLPVWLWIVIVAALCVKCSVLAACCGGKKPKKKKKKVSQPKPPAPVEEPLPELAPLMPLATTSQFVPSYPMVAQPQYAYAQSPATTSYQYAAAPTAFAQPQFTYAAPATGAIV